PDLIPDPEVDYTSPESAGMLRLRPVPGAVGTATITVTVKDDGGTARGGNDTTVRSFTVTINPLPTATHHPEQEPNGDRPPATVRWPDTPGDPGSIWSGTLPPGDVDWCRIDVTGPGRLTAAVAATGGFTRLALFDASGRLLVQSDGTSATDPTPRLDQYLAPGRFYLEILGQGPESVTTSYTLTIDFQPAQPLFQPLNSGGVVPSLGPRPIQVVDINGDGRPDLVEQGIGGVGDPGIQVLLSRGDGTFGDAITWHPVDQAMWEYFSFR